MRAAADLVASPSLRASMSRSDLLLTAPPPDQSVCLRGELHPLESFVDVWFTLSLRLRGARAVSETPSGPRLG